MKTYVSFLSVCYLLASNAYAISEKENQEPTTVKQQDSKPLYKITKRRVLRSLLVEENETSNFSLEELRLGYQKNLKKSEIEYLKSQCRYAFMSDKEVIQYHCETKKVVTSK